LNQLIIRMDFLLFIQQALWLTSGRWICPLLYRGCAASQSHLHHFASFFTMLHLNFQRLHEEDPMTQEDREKQIEELKQELSELRKVRSNHGAHTIDFQMLEIEDQIAELRNPATVD